MISEEPLRILQCVNIMDRAGLETMLMNYYRKIDRNKIQFDFLTHREREGLFDGEIESMGGHVYHAPRLMPQNYTSYFKFMEEFFSQHGYAIVHSHIDAMSWFPLLAAKRAGVKNRIAHSHSSSVDFDYKFPIKQCARFGLRKIANWYFACGNAAGAYLFGKRLWNGERSRLIRNAVDSSIFKYNDLERKTIRASFGISNTDLVLGHVGRFEKVKNHSFLLKVLEAAKITTPNCKLLLVGDGPLRRSIENEARQKGLEDSIVFAGVRTDVNKIMSALDVFILPSIYEGMPMTVIEARCSGLPVVVSDSLPDDVTDLSGVDSLSLEDNPTSWAQCAIHLACSYGGDRRASSVFAERSEFDIGENCANLQRLYLQMLDDVNR